MAVRVRVCILEMPLSTCIATAPACLRGLVRGQAFSVGLGADAASIALVARSGDVSDRSCCAGSDRSSSRRAKRRGWRRSLAPHRLPEMVVCRRQSPNGCLVAPLTVLDRVEASTLIPKGQHSRGGKHSGLGAISNLNPRERQRRSGSERPGAVMACQETRAGPDRQVVRVPRTFRGRSRER